MKKLLCLLGGAMLAIQLRAQTIQPLAIGDSVPDIVISNIINSKTSQVNLSDIHKPIIIDFFATWCGPCVEALPHFDSLQRQFGDSIQIFVVSHEPEQKIEDFLQKNTIGKNINLIFSADDTILRKYFPYNTVPHEVIISNQKVQAITYNEYITEDEIHKLYVTGEINLPLKRDFFNFDPMKPLFNNNIGKALDMTLNQFLLTKYIEGLGGKSGIIFNADSTRKRIYKTNGGILGYFLLAAGFQKNYNRIILNVSDSSEYIRTNENWVEWARDNYYSLEMIVPAEWSETRVNSWMFKEFNLCLDVQLSLKKCNIRCWVLRKSTPKRHCQEKEISHNTKAAVWAPHHWENYNDSRLLKDSIKEYSFNSINRLITFLNRQKVGRPLVPVVLDETGVSGSVNIRLRLKNIQNLPETSKALKKYGLELVPAFRNVKMLVIEEKEPRGQFKDL